ncbi:MFS transporter [Pseudonocardia zijingensis]|uniref:MFS transporter n=1 Tax=Pseudonocardia zijingensis TaxID=153376 RepID=A0ABN1N8R4_9PSEU
MTSAPGTTAAADARRWVILAIGVCAQTSACAYVYGAPFLVPQLRDTLGLSLATVGRYVAAPVVGLLLALVAWGAAADRFGERRVMSTGLLLGSVAMGVAALAPVGHSTLRLVLLALGGALAASVFAASGRLVMGWFPRHERGVAMGVRQTAQPLGVALAGFTLPSLAATAGTFAALALPAALCLVMGVLVAAFAADPPRAQLTGTAATGSPYRAALLWRVHAASALLVMPQFAVSAFSVEYLVRERGFTAAAAGLLVGAVQFVGAAGRIGVGWWSDRVGSRMRPMRQVSVATVVVLVAFAVGDLYAPWLAVAALVAGGLVTVAHNGLGYTATAEIAGPAWSGRALGVQNTGQNVVSALTPPVLGAVIGTVGYAAGFLLATVAPVVAVLVTPVRQEPSSRW